MRAGGLTRRRLAGVVRAGGQPDKDSLEQCVNGQPNTDSLEQCKQGQSDKDSLD